MRELLPEDAVEAFRSGHAHWHVTDGRLVRIASAPDFRTAIDWVVAVAQVAEEQDHHPDIDIRWCTVSFGLWTHSAGGITALDLDLARRIDALVITRE